MDTIPQKELRNKVGEILRRAESGEQITITVAGRPVAELGPVGHRQWVSGSDLQSIWKTASPMVLSEDLERFPGQIEDPYA